jgi:hypothetical protein
MDQHWEECSLSSIGYGNGRCSEPLFMLLGAGGIRCYRAAMYTLGRFLQVVGLTIPPLAIIAELNQSNPGLMLKFLLAAVGFFTLGYLLQRYSGGKT